MDEEYDEWELMYGNDLEAANELEETQKDLNSLAQMGPPQAENVEPNHEIDKISFDNISQDSEDVDMQPDVPYTSEKRDINAGYILTRPSLTNPTIACVLASGERVFIKKKEFEAPRMKIEGDDSSLHWKLGTSVKDMLENIRKRAIEKEVEEEIRLEQEVSTSSTSKTSNQSEDLWLDKYRPRHFIDLLSDERTNREVLGWLKSWDACVFPQKVKQVPSKLKTPVLTKPADSRPEQKIILICGPPGAGKTTLAGIAARHAGYNPIEINASDDRTANVLKEKIISAMEMQSIFGDQRPNCIILDEIDGAMAGQEGKGAITALQAFINAPYAQSSSKKAKKTTSRGHPLIRPIICICNDQFAPVLRPLRKLAKIFVMHTPEPRQLAQRLKYICKLESVQASNSLLSTLCERADNDVRFCLNALQFASARTPTLTVSMIDTMMGRKDVSKGAYDVWETVFYKSKEQQKSPSAAFNRVFESADRFGSHELVINGLHENLLSLAFSDPTLVKIHNALEWMGFSDLCDTKIRSHQQFQLTPYCSMTAIAVHNACCTGSRRRIEYPKSFYNFRKQRETTQSILEAFVEPGTQLRLGSRVLVSDVIPPIVSMLNPMLLENGTQNEKEAMDRLISFMSTLHVSYKQVQLPGGVSEYALEPPLDMLVKYKSMEPRHRLPVGIRQNMSREVELETMRRSEKSTIVSLPRTAPTEVYDSSNPFGLKKRKREDQVHANAKRWPIRYKFNEGYTCGIKRSVLVQDLL